MSEETIPPETMIGGILIENMTDDDIPAVVRIEQISSLEPWSAASFLGELKNPLSVLRVVRYNADPVGFISAVSVADEGQILNIAVHPAYRRRGLATALVNAVFEVFRLRGCRKVYLEVRPSNQAASNFYRGLGFSRIDIRKGYYQATGEDAVVMMLAL